MKKFILPFAALLLFSCFNNNSQPIDNKTAAPAQTKAAETSAEAKGGHYEGAFTNGMKETYISFDVSPDGKELRELTFKGYWYCGGKLTQERAIGPEEHFTIQGNKVDGVIVDKASYTRFELHGTINGNKAEGTYRMSITGLDCDTRVLTWTAERK